MTETLAYHMGTHLKVYSEKANQWMLWTKVALALGELTLMLLVAFLPLYNDAKKLKMAETLAHIGTNLRVLS